MFISISVTSLRLQSAPWIQFESGRRAFGEETFRLLSSGSATSGIESEVLSAEVRCLRPRLGGCWRVSWNSVRARTAELLVASPSGRCAKSAYYQVSLVHVSTAETQQNRRGGTLTTALHSRWADCRFRRSGLSPHARVSFRKPMTGPVSDAAANRRLPIHRPQLAPERQPHHQFGGSGSRASTAPNRLARPLPSRA